MRGDNFILVDGDTAAAVLARFFATQATFPAMGRVATDPPVKPAMPVEKRNRAVKIRTGNAREKMSRSALRRHASRLRIRLDEMDTYRWLRRRKRLTQAEAVNIIRADRSRKS